MNFPYFPCPGGSPFLTVKLARPSSDSNLNRVSSRSTVSSERIVSCESRINSVSSFGSLGGCDTYICYGIFGGVCV